MPRYDDHRNDPVLPGKTTGKRKVPGHTGHSKAAENDRDQSADPKVSTRVKGHWHDRGDK